MHARTHTKEVVSLAPYRTSKAEVHGNSCEICAGKGGTGIDFSQTTSGFPRQLSFHKCAYISVILNYNNRPSWSREISELSPRHHRKLKKRKQVVVHPASESCF